MRKIVIVVSALVGVCGLAASAQAQCVPVLGSAGQPETLCGDFRPLRIAPAALGDPPLVWSASTAALVPLPADGRARLVGPTIPLDDLIGRRVVGIGRPPAPVLYNNPSSFLGSVDPGLVLMRLPARHRLVVRRTAFRAMGAFRLGPRQVISVKD